MSISGTATRMAVIGLEAESYGGSYDNSYQQPSGDFSEIPDDDAGELPF